MLCRYWKEDKIYRGWPARCVGSIITCTADGHEPNCGGLRPSCDKEMSACPEAIMQGPDAFCKAMREIGYSCRGDVHWCELSEAEKKDLLSCK